MENNEMPVGFGMALAMNPKAMEKFASSAERKTENYKRYSQCFFKIRNEAICGKYNIIFLISV